MRPPHTRRRRWRRRDGSRDPAQKPCGPQGRWPAGARRDSDPAAYRQLPQVLVVDDRQSMKLAVQAVSPCRACRRGSASRLSLAPCCVSGRQPGASHQLDRGLRRRVDVRLDAQLCVAGREHQAIAEDHEVTRMIRGLASPRVAPEHLTGSLDGAIRRPEPDRTEVRPGPEPQPPSIVRLEPRPEAAVADARRAARRSVRRPQLPHTAVQIQEPREPTSDHDEPAERYVLEGGGRLARQQPTT